jgi:hypothetical protein
MRLRNGETLWNPTPSMRHLTLLPVGYASDRPKNYETWMNLQEMMLQRLVSEAETYEIEEASAYLAETLPELTAAPDDLTRFPQAFLLHQPETNLELMHWREQAKRMLDRGSVSKEKAREHAEGLVLGDYLTSILNP